MLSNDERYWVKKVLEEEHTTRIENKNGCQVYIVDVPEYGATGYGFSLSQAIQEAYIQVELMRMDHD